MGCGEIFTVINFILCTGHEQRNCALKFLTNNPKGNRPVGNPKRRWEDNIRMDLKEIGINRWNWIDSTLDSDYWRTLENVALNLRIP